MSPRCCSPASADRHVLAPFRQDATKARPRATTRGGPELVDIPASVFRMGGTDDDGNPGDGEGPVRPVSLPAFEITRYPVTNADYAAFVAETGYTTGAEKHGWSFVFDRLLPARLVADARRWAAAPWWVAVAGADWAHPQGPGSGIEDIQDHPVVHVDHADAEAFCHWAGGRLPSEAEWECAARGGLDQARYPWGDELTPDGQHRCNIWQGSFPSINTAEDGYVGTSPVSAYPPNGYGLYDMAGNVWEWCADWWQTPRIAHQSVKPGSPEPGGTRVTRGGSYLCHASYCNRYRVAARTSSDPYSSAGNLGFRMAHSG